jgi:hypothetical protein
MTSSRSSSGAHAALLRERLALGQQQRQQPQALLALGAEDPQLPVVAQEREVVAVRPVLGEAALQVGVQALGELRRELLRRCRPATGGR